MSMDLLNAFVADDAGSSAVEYALLLAFIGAALALAAGLLGSAVEGELNANKEVISP